MESADFWRCLRSLARYFSPYLFRLAPTLIKLVVNGSVLMNGWLFVVADTIMHSHWPHFPLVAAPQSRLPSPPSLSATASLSSLSLHRPFSVPPMCLPATGAGAIFRPPPARPAPRGFPVVPAHNAPAPFAAHLRHPLPILPTAGF
jgi:hypothetical protein